MILNCEKSIYYLVVIILIHFDHQIHLCSPPTFCTIVYDLFWQILICFDSYLPEFLWRERVKREGGDPFLALMKLIAEKQKDLTPSEDLSKVLQYLWCIVTYICFEDEFVEELRAPMWDYLFFGEHFTTKEQNRMHVPPHCKESPEWDFYCLACGLEYPTKSACSPS